MKAFYRSALCYLPCIICVLAAVLIHRGEQAQRIRQADILHEVGSQLIAEQLAMRETISELSSQVQYLHRELDWFIERNTD